ASWTNGPLNFQARLSAETTSQFLKSTNSAPALALTQSNTVSPLSIFEKSAIELDVRGDEKGITISNLVATASTGVVAVAHGFLPVAVYPAEKSNLLQIRTNEPLQFRMATQPNSIFWSHLAQWSGIILTDPEFQVDVTGSLETPQGVAQLRARQIEIKKIKAKVPKLERLQVELVMDQQQARLQKGEVLVEGQPVTLTAQMPLGPGFWEGLTRKQGPKWDNASAHLRMSNAQVAAFADLFPTLISPQGHFDLDAQMLPGGTFKGEFSIAKARTRPCPSVGATRDME